jgi:hypothetical protein
MTMNGVVWCMCSLETTWTHEREKRGMHKHIFFLLYVTKTKTGILSKCKRGHQTIFNTNAFLLFPAIAFASSSFSHSIIT